MMLSEEMLMAIKADTTRKAIPVLIKANAVRASKWRHRGHNPGRCTRKKYQPLAYPTKAGTRE